MPGCLASSNLPPREVEMKSMPARAKARPNAMASASPLPPRRIPPRDSGSRPRNPARPRHGRRRTLRAAAGPGSQPRRRSRPGGCSWPRGTTPSYRHGHNAVRRRRNRPSRARAAASANRPGSTCGRSRICGRCVSVTRSRAPKRSASRSRSSRIGVELFGPAEPPGCRGSRHRPARLDGGASGAGR